MAPAWIEVILLVEVVFPLIFVAVYGQPQPIRCDVQWGRQPNPADEACETFYSCSNWSGVLEQCPTGQFDFAQLRCRKDEDVWCEDQRQNLGPEIAQTPTVEQETTTQPPPATTTEELPPTTDAAPPATTAAPEEVTTPANVRRPSRTELLLRILFPQLFGDQAAAGRAGTGRVVPLNGGNGGIAPPLNNRFNGIAIAPQPNNNWANGVGPIPIPNNGINALGGFAPQPNNAVYGVGNAPINGANGLGIVPVANNAGINLAPLPNNGGLQVPLQPVVGANAIFPLGANLIQNKARLGARESGGLGIPQNIAGQRYRPENLQVAKLSLIGSFPLSRANKSSSGTISRLSDIIHTLTSEKINRESAPNKTFVSQSGDELPLQKDSNSVYLPGYRPVQTSFGNSAVDHINGNGGRRGGPLFLGGHGVVLELPE